MDNILKIEKEKILQYEINMFRNTCDNLFSLSHQADLPNFWRALLVESLAAHTRVLVCFFYDEKKYPDDIIAQDLLPDFVDWSKLRPELHEILEEARKKAHKQLAHLSLTRILLKREGNHIWKVCEISREMNNVIKCFYDAKKYSRSDSSPTARNDKKDG